MTFNRERKKAMSFNDIAFFRDISIRDTSILSFCRLSLRERGRDT